MRKKKIERVALGANAKTKKKTEENDALSALSAYLRARERSFFFTVRIALVSTDGFARVK